ncbi:hypothetical protein H8D51_03165 [bacterium]|nr:hypothetical protein [bacterium]
MRRSPGSLLVITTASDPVPARGAFLQLVPGSPEEPGLTIGKKNGRVVALPDGKMARHIEQLISRKE